jgi:hypothetical protein
MRRPTPLEAESQCGARRQPCGASWEVHPVTRAGSGSGPGRQGRGCWSRARTRTVPVSWSVASNLRSGGARFIHISTYHWLRVPMFHVKHGRGHHLRSLSLRVPSEHGLGSAACETKDPRLGVGKARWSPPSVCGTASEASPRTPLRRRGHGWSRSRFTPWLQRAGALVLFKQDVDTDDPPPKSRQAIEAQNQISRRGSRTRCFT